MNTYIIRSKFYEHIIQSRSSEVKHTELVIKVIFSLSPSLTPHQPLPLSSPPSQYNPNLLIASMSLKISLTTLLLIGSLLLAINEAKPAADQQQDPGVMTDQVPKANQEEVTKANQDEEPAQNKVLKPLENEAAERVEDQEAEALLTEELEQQAIKDKELSVNDEDNKEDEEGDDEPTANQDPECLAEWKSFQES